MGSNIAWIGNLLLRHFACIEAPLGMVSWYLREPKFSLVRAEATT